MILSMLQYALGVTQAQSGVFQSDCASSHAVESALKDSSRACVGHKAAAVQLQLENDSHMVVYMKIIRLAVMPHKLAAAAPLRGSEVHRRCQTLCALQCRTDAMAADLSAN